MAFDFKNLTSKYIDAMGSDIVGPLEFIESSWGLKLSLTPVQKFIVKCFYGLELDDNIKTIAVPNYVNTEILFRFTEVEFLNWLYENKKCNTNSVLGKNFKELIMSVGRRAGKSIVASAISCYEAYRLIMRKDPNKYYTFPENQTIHFITAAPTDDQAEIVFENEKLMLMTCKFIKDRVIKETKEFFYVQTDSDKEIGDKVARIKFLAGNCSSASLRGHASIVIVFDEMAFFIDNGGRFSGDEVYKALSPSAATFKAPGMRGDGKLILLSSPSAKYGKFYDRVMQSYDEPDSVFMLRLPSSVMNPNIDSDYLKSEYKKDRRMFVQEYGAEFGDSVMSWIADESNLLACVNPANKNRTKGETGQEYFIGIDYGAKNDATAFAIVHRGNDGKIIVDRVEGWFNEGSDVWEKENSIYKDCLKYNGDFISASSLAERVNELNNWFPIKKGNFDQFNGYGILEELYKYNLHMIEMVSSTEMLNSKIFQIMRTLIENNLIEFPAYDPLIKELLLLESEQRTKNKCIVKAPNKKGAHDDLANALGLAVALCYEEYANKSVSNPGVVSGNNVQHGGNKLINYAAYKINRAKLGRPVKSTKFTNIQRGMR